MDGFHSLESLLHITFNHNVNLSIESLSISTVLLLSDSAYTELGLGIQLLELINWLLWAFTLFS